MDSSTVNYFNFITDIRRAVFCLQNGNNDGSKTFLTHAHSIYQNKLKTEKKLIQDFDSTWTSLYNTSIPQKKDEVKAYCEKLLTLSSMIFLRVKH